MNTMGSSNGKAARSNHCRDRSHMRAWPGSPGKHFFTQAHNYTAIGARIPTPRGATVPAGVPAGTASLIRRHFLCPCHMSVYMR